MPNPGSFPYFAYIIHLNTQSRNQEVYGRATIDANDTSFFHLAHKERTTRRHKLQT